MISEGISRRSFLAYGALSAVLSGLLPRAALALPATYCKAENKYLFADQPSLGPDITAPNIEQQCCALHQEVSLGDADTKSTQYRSIENLLKREFLNSGLSWDDSYRIGFTYQHYGVPDNSSYAAELLAYCKDAHQYLYDRLSNLFDVNMNWQQLSHNNNHSHRNSNSQGFTGFVGRYTYYVLRAVVLNPPENSDPPYLVSAWPLERAINYIVSGETYMPVSGTVYIIPGTTGLLAPFSELLHLTLHAASQRYAAELGDTIPAEEADNLARIAGETTNESAASLLAIEYLGKQRCSQRTDAIGRVMRSMSRKFSQIPRSIEYMQRVGVQEALNIYQDNPAEYMHRIG